MKSNFKSFSDWNGQTVELGYAYIGMSDAEFATRFPGIKGIRCDSWSMYVGTINKQGSTGGEGSPNFLPVTRRIAYKAQPSLHECNAKCLNGKANGACECKCGGKNHGRGNI